MATDALRDIEARVLAGERLSFDDGVRLFRSRDLFLLGRLANLVRERKNGNRAYYVKNMHLNYSNVCVFDCQFCSFYRREGADGAWEMDLDAIFAYAAKARFESLNEIHIVGGVHPKLPWRYYLEMLRGLKERYPELHLKAFTATEIDHFTKIAKKSAREVLVELREAGLDSLPGGGAEIFADRVWNRIASGKARPERWLEIHRTWHGLGGRSTSTMLYGHLETDEERVDHMLRLRTLQDETSGFTAFIPLAFQVENNQLRGIPKPTAQTDLKVHAVARLLLDNVDHIKAYWIMTGLKMAQILLSYGADDIDGTILEERIVHMAGADSPLGVSEEEMRALIREAGREPVRRDSLYRPLEPVRA
ncbi:MAG TPA: aminofutalosine synthase MqnE [Planctomycetota bacterium]|nr:aminofutalosine synthase MqnE [Planctomycetota bacterium]